MAVMSPVPASPQISFQYLGAPRLIKSCSPEIVEEPVQLPRITEDIIYVAVGEIVKESTSTLLWALQNSGGKRIGILHVHQPSKTIPMMGTRFHPNSLEEQEVKAYRIFEKKNMLKILDQYLCICRQMGAQAVQLHYEKDCIEKGIVELISQHGIKKLVMGAAADKNYSRPDAEVESSLPQESPDASDYIKGSGKDIPFPHGNEKISTGVTPLINGLNEEGCADECKGKGSPRSPQDSNSQTCSSTVGVSFSSTSSCSGAHCTEVKAAESLYAMELKHRKEIDEVLAKEREALEKVTKERDQVIGELQTALNHRSLLESQMAESKQQVKGMELRISSVIELLQIYKRERDEMQMERDAALRAVEELRRNQEAASFTCMPQFFNEFSFSEIEEATHNFDQSLKIGQGGYGNIYKGFLRCNQVAVKMLQSDSSQGPSEFQQEVYVLSKLKHPNLVKLIGSCPQVYALIYEFLPNGSLDDRLSCKDNTTPLSWQTRIRIATELCSVLVFLHSHNIVHGDLKPSNILLDATFISKLSDFGICRILYKTSSDTTLCHRTVAKGTFAYMDPEFVHTGVLTIKSDVYSFGIILLQLLTGRPAFGIKTEVEYAINAGNLIALLDPLAGYWPFGQAEQICRLALKCCDMYRKFRPDLGSEVWQVLEPMRATYYGGSSSISLYS
uniref:RING-type E3 ubiquitin transferase n=1 Tax=Fagus sylvatica TaxID=28930 RepID=A0A2N9FJ82_FAGSY